MSRVVILVFADPLADKMLTGEEYAAISENMAHGISCFAPNFGRRSSLYCGSSAGTSGF